MLNDREARALRFACREYRQRYGRQPEEDPDLFVYLGDNPEKRMCWSAVSQRIPTFRTGNGFMYNPHGRRWMTPTDKLAALGFPVTAECAFAMGVPTIPVADVMRASSVAGNSFHFSTAAVVQLIALSCHRLVSPKQ